MITKEEIAEKEPVTEVHKSVKESICGKMFMGSIGVSLIAVAVLADYLSLGGRVVKSGFGNTQWMCLIVGAVMIVLALCLSRKLAKILLYDSNK